jgi:hypothetical protein
MTRRFAPQLALVPGTRERLVRIEAVTNMHQIRPDALVAQWTIAMVVSAFLCGVNVGCFAERLARLAEVHAGATHEERGLRRQSWEISFPAMPPGAFRALVWMASSSECLGSGLVSLSIQELGVNHLARITREQVEPLPTLHPPFAVRTSVGGEQKEIHVAATFAAPLNSTCSLTVKKLFEMWGTVLYLGGFPGAGLPFSMGFVRNVYHYPETVVGVIDGFNGTPEAWEALLRGFCRIHASSPLTRVDVT